MTVADLTRLAIYGIALIAAAVVAVIAAVNGNEPMLGVAFGWIATNILATLNIRGREAPVVGAGDHAA